MAAILGKRKRRTGRNYSLNGDFDGNSLEESNQEHLQELFRKHFEAQYEPLPYERPAAIAESIPLVDQEIEDMSSEDSWNGLSDEEVNAEAVEVIDYSARRPRRVGESTVEGEMHDSLPSTTIKSALLSANTASPSNLASEFAQQTNDLALHKLLRESHLLHANNSTTSMDHPHSLSLSGRARHVAQDTHLMTLGAKSSIHEQKSMPMSHRRGIATKRSQREDDRRKEAREAGIILEREGGKERTRGLKKQKERRDGVAGVGEPGVGRWRGGTLNLSRKDIESIQGRKGSGLSRGKGAKSKRGRN